MDVSRKWKVGEVSTDKWLVLVPSGSTAACCCPHSAASVSWVCGSSVYKPGSERWSQHAPSQQGPWLKSQTVGNCSCLQNTVLLRWRPPDAPSGHTCCPPWCAAPSTPHSGGCTRQSTRGCSQMRRGWSHRKQRRQHGHCGSNALPCFSWNALDLQCPRSAAGAKQNQSFKCCYTRVHFQIILLLVLDSWWFREHSLSLIMKGWLFNRVGQWFGSTLKHVSSLFPLTSVAQKIVAYLSDEMNRGVMKNVIKSLFFLSSPHLYIYPVELQRPLSKINPDGCLGVLQESTPAESVRQTRLSNIWISDDYYLKDPRLRAVIVVVWGELQGVVQTDNGAEILLRFVFYCHCSCSRGPDVDNMEISR